MASKKSSELVFLVFLKNVGFGFLTVTETAPINNKLKRHLLRLYRTDQNMRKAYSVYRRNCTIVLSETENKPNVLTSLLAETETS